MRRAAIALALIATACGSPDLPTEEQARAAARGETRGFVFSSFAMVIPPVDPASCPDGFNLNAKQWEEELGAEVATDCGDPGAHPDPGFMTFDAPVSLAGLDLDGRASKKTPGESCAHDDFTGPKGELGIDHQLWRVVGCTRGYQRGDLIDEIGRTAIRSGSFGNRKFRLRSGSKSEYDR